MCLGVMRTEGRDRQKEKTARNVFNRPQSHMTKTNSQTVSKDGLRGDPYVVYNYIAAVYGTILYNIILPIMTAH